MSCTARRLRPIRHGRRARCAGATRRGGTSLGAALFSGEFGATEYRYSFQQARRFGRSRNRSLVRDSSLRHCLRRFGPPAPCARRALPAVRRGRYRRWRRVEITKQASKSGYLLYNIIMRRRERRAPRRCVDRASTTRWRRARRYTLYDGAMTRCLCVRRSRVDAVGPANCPFCVDFCSACHVSPVFPISRFVPSVRETKVVFGWPPLFGC